MSDADDNDNDNVEQTKSSSKKAGKSVDAGVIAVAIIAILAIGGVAGFIFGIANSPPSKEQPANFVSLPTVSSPIKSSKDGKPHSIDIDITVEYANDAAAVESQNAVYNKVKEAISTLDYEDLKRADGIEYIEKRVKNSLDEVGDADSLSNVYVGNIAIDFPGVVKSNETGKQNNTDAKLKGLFNNIK